MKRRIFSILAILILTASTCWASSQTTNLRLNKPGTGDRNWGQTVNNNMDLLDAAYGNYVTSADDLPEVYIYADTFNGPTGRVITLPKSVSGVNEYAVTVAATSRAGAIGDIYVTKTTTNFTVHCAEANTTDTFSASVYYIGDVSSYGGSIYRKWYVSTDSGITDHGNAATTGSLAWVQAQISTTPAVVELPGNKNYQLKQNLTIVDNIQLVFQKGGIIDTDFSIRDGNYEWYQNGATSEYYLQASGGGNPNINMPSTVIENNSQMTDGAAGSLAAGEWDWNDVNGLGYTTVYVRLSDSTDPDGKGADYVEAGYTLTLEAPPPAGLYQIFDGQGIVSLTKISYPQWFGALADGVQDDQPYIQKAADSLSTGVLRLVAGDYMLNTMQPYTSANTGIEYGIIVIDNPISIKGDGGENTKLNVTLDDTFYGTIVLNGVNGSTVEGLYIKGTGTAYSGGYGGGIRVLLSSRTVIKNNLFEDLRGIAINYVGNFNLAVGNTDVDYYCTYNIADGNVIRNNAGDGIYHYFSKYASVVNNILYKAGFTDAIIFEGCDHGVISNNVILEPNQRSILVNTGSSFTTVTGNTIYHYHAATVSDSILLSSVRYCTVNGNIIEYAVTGATPQRAIVLDDGAYAWLDTYHNISNNIIKNAGRAVDFPALAVQTDYNNVSGNTISGGTYGIGVDGADYNTISNNQIHDSGTPIMLEGQDGRADPTYTLVANNYCDGNLAGISIASGCDNTKMINNYMSIAAYIHPSSTNNTALGNIPSYEIITSDGAISMYKDTSILDSSGGATLVAMLDGLYPGQKKTIIMTDATASIVVSISNHLTSAPEWATFDAVGEMGVFVWSGSVWITQFATCTF